MKTTRAMFDLSIAQDGIEWYVGLVVVELTKDRAPICITWVEMTVGQVSQEHFKR